MELQLELVTIPLNPVHPTAPTALPAPAAPSPSLEVLLQHPLALWSFP